jgi:hypothetical protein
MIDADHIAEARATSIADVLAGHLAGMKRHGAEYVGSCPRCGGRDRFSINLTKGDGVFNCRGCGGKGGGAIDLTMWLNGCGFAEAVEHLVGGSDRSRGPKPTTRPKPHHQHDDAEHYARQQRRKAGWLWSLRQPIGGTIAERYLREARGYTTGLIPPTIAYLPPNGAHGPSMIAAFAAPPSGSGPGLIKPVAVHLTKLKPDGSGKADVSPNKIVVGSPLGMPIVISPIGAEPHHLCICEGIEDALTIRLALHLRCWTAGAAGFMPALADPMPSYIETVTIYSHDDEAGQRGAQALAERLDARGIEVFLEGLA